LTCTGGLSSSRRAKGRREFRQYLRIAGGSLNEAGTRLRDGHARGYWSDSELAEVLQLEKRTGICITRLIQSLST
jgi:four helix bundle protein